MKKLFLIFILLGAGFVAMSQTYVGTLTTGSYSQKNVTVRLSQQSGMAVIFMQKVKFARMMPVKIDVTIPSLAIATDPQGGKQLTGNNILPTSDKKTYDKFRVTDFKGVAGSSLNFSCMMGDKKVSFSGTQRNSADEQVVATGVSRPTLRWVNGLTLLCIGDYYLFGGSATLLKQHGARIHDTVYHFLCIVAYGDELQPLIAAHMK